MSDRWLRVVVRTFAVTETGISAAEIGRGADDVYEAPGGGPAHDLDDWLEADGELEPRARPDDFKELP